MTLPELAGRTALITGAASGIGRGLARRAAAEAMNVVVVDVEEDALADLVAELTRSAASIHSFVVDVADRTAVAGLADEIHRRFDGVDLLCNNAGVGMRGLIWERNYDDWDWLLGVNLGGVISGVHEFVPRMVERGTPGHVVNTASIAGLFTAPRSGIYSVTKFGVVALSECLAHDLEEVGANVGVSVLCPGWVQSRITDASRNRPRAHQGAVDDSDRERELDEYTRVGVAAGLEPDSVARAVFEAVRSGIFWVMTHDYSAAIESRFASIMEAQRRVAATGSE